MSSRVLLAEVGALLAAGLVLLVIVWSPWDSSGVVDDPPAVVAGEDNIGDDDDGGLSTTDAPEDGGEESQGDDCAPAASADFMRGNQILTYYGNPDAETLGILGQHEPDELLALLKTHARTYDELNGFRGVQPGLHMVYATAQAYAGEDGLYIRRVDSDTVEDYIDFACENGLFIFLDLQLGRADLETEINKLLPYLERSHVHLSLDPEFAMAQDEVPGEHIGHLNADQINRAQEILQNLLDEKGLPDKILIVHQFQDDMIRDRTAIQDYPRVRLVVDMDGFGEPAAKMAKYQTFSAIAEYGGIKLFFQQDHPLMTEDEVLDVRPDLIIYQ
jgi:hypothetical protein